MRASRSMLSKHALMSASSIKSSNGIQAIGLSDGPSRHLGTHQRPSLPTSRIDEAGALRSGPLCCPAHPHYSDPLRLPLGYQPLSGLPVIGKARSQPPQGQGRVGPLQFPRQPSDRSSPLRRRVLRHPLQDFEHLPWPSPNPHKLGTLSFPLTAGAFTTLQTSLHAADVGDG